MNQLLLLNQNAIDSTSFSSDEIEQLYSNTIKKGDRFTKTILDSINSSRKKQDLTQQNPTTLQYTAINFANQPFKRLDNKSGAQEINSCLLQDKVEVSNECFSQQNINSQKIIMKDHQNNNDQQFNFHESYCQNINNSYQIIQISESGFGIEKKTNKLNPIHESIITHFDEKNINQQLDEKFIKEKPLILISLAQNQFYLGQFLAKGGEGQIFEGYIHDRSKVKQEVVFKIIFDADQSDIDDEIKIMKQFEGSLNIIKLIDFTKISDRIFVFVLEKCKYSLQQELQTILKNTQSFPLLRFLSIIFDLLDGLILFKIYHTLHLDIKPQNILITQNGYCVYTDFGLSVIYNKEYEVRLRGYTRKYAPYEQIEDLTRDVEYSSDTYSLGMTLSDILKVYKFTDPENKEISTFIEQEIISQMIDKKIRKRQKCEKLHQKLIFFLISLKNNEYLEFLFSYLEKIQSILKLQPYGDNKNTPYLLETKVYYSLIYLDILNNKVIHTPYIQDEKNIDNNKNEAENSTLFSLISINNVLSEFQENQQFQEVNKYQKQLLKMKTIENMITKENNKNTYFYQKQFEILNGLFKIDNPLIVSSLNDVGQCYQDICDYDNALCYYLLSYRMNQRLYKETHIDIADSLNRIGSCFLSISDSYTALKYQDESLCMRKKLFQGNQPDIANSFYHLGLCYLDINYEKALMYLIQSLEMRKQLFNENHEDIATNLRWIGYLYSKINDDNNSLNYSLESLQMAKELFKGNHPVIAESLHQVGICLFSIQQSEIALRFYKESFQINYKLFNKNHESTAVLLLNIGYCYLELENPQIAINYLKQSLKIFQKLFKCHHRFIVWNLIFKAECNLAIENEKDALRDSLKSLSIVNILYREKNYLTLQCLNTLSKCFNRIGNFNIAIDYGLQCIKLQKQLFKYDNINLTVYLRILGNIYYNNNQFAESLSYYLDVLKIFQSFNIGNHYLIAEAMNDLGQCYQKMDNLKKAESYFIESVKMIKKVCKENDKKIAIFIFNLGKYYFEIKQFEKSLSYFQETQRILIMYQQQKGTLLICDNKYLADTFEKIGISYNKIGDFDNALINFLDSFQIKKQLYKEYHYQIEKSLDLIVTLYDKIGDHKNALNYKLQLFKVRRVLYKKDDFEIEIVLKQITKIQLNSLELLNLRKVLNNQNQMEIISQLRYVGEIIISLGSLKDFHANINSLPETLKMIQEFQAGDLYHKAYILNSLGTHYLWISDFKKAKRYFFDSLDIRKELNKGDHLDTAKTLSNIGECYENIRRYEKALYFRKEALNMKRQLIKEVNIEIIKELSAIGRIYDKLDDHKNSLIYFQESLTQKIQLNQDHHQIEQSLGNIVIQYLKIKDYENTLKYSLEFLPERKAQNFKNDKEIPNFLHLMGHCYLKIGDYEVGKNYLLESLKTSQVQHNYQNHEIPAQFLDCLGIYYLKMKDFEQAKIYLFDSLQMSTDLENDKNIIQSLLNISEYFKMVKSYEQALSYRQEALHRKQKSFYYGDYEKAKDMLFYGEIYDNLGDFEKALSYFEKSLILLKEREIRNDNLIARFLSEMSEYCLKNKSFENALNYGQEALNIKLKLYKESNSEIVEDINRIEIIQSILDNPEKFTGYLEQSDKFTKQIFTIYNKNVENPCFIFNNV